ncbi:MAG: gamma-glutamylcyclotransferase [Pirellulaceae bacterium]|nr:MAG: gamma-glutamylcyclotransferase [Pirellulaceae bacterium]
MNRTSQTPHIKHVFVYGTLKSTQCRAKSWPCRPISIASAWTLGTLYDLGSYPALDDGDGMVLGEVWELHETDMARTLQVLDAIEGTNQPHEPDLYERRILPVHFLDANRTVDAYAYFYCQKDELTPERRILPYLERGGKRFACWPST